MSTLLPIQSFLFIALRIIYSMNQEINIIIWKIQFSSSLDPWKPNISLGNSKNHGFKYILLVYIYIYISIYIIRIDHTMSPVKRAYQICFAYHKANRPGHPIDGQPLNSITGQKPIIPSRVR